MKGLDPKEKQDLLLTIGSHKGVRRLEPVEAARLLRRAILAGETANSLASGLHLDGSSMVTRFLGLLNLAEDIQYMVGWGMSEVTIGFSAACEISRIEDKSSHLTIVRAVLEHRMKKDEVIQLKQLMNRSTKSPEECIGEVLSLSRTEIETIFVLVGKVTSSPVVSYLRSLKQGEKDALLKNVVGRMDEILMKASYRLGESRFTISGSEDVMEGLVKQDKGFECYVNELLQAEIADG